MTDARYRLYAVVEHEGSMSFGHYTAYVDAAQSQDGTSATWFHISDGNARQSSMAAAMAAQAFLLFYRKV